MRSCCVALGFIIYAGCTQLTTEKPAVSEELRVEAIAKLRDVDDNQQRWVKVHAAEWLLELGYSRGIAKAFRNELEKHGEEPEYRIGIWRVLAKTPPGRNSKAWIDKIKGVCFDESAPDRTHATETLAKLRQSIVVPKQRDQLVSEAVNGDTRLGAFARWLLVYTSEEQRDKSLSSLIELLQSTQSDSRRIAAFALQQLGPLDEANWKKLVESAKTESDPITKVRLQGAILITAPETADKSALEAIRTELLQSDSQTDSKLNIELTRILADVGKPNDIALLEKYLQAVPPETLDEAEKSVTADLNAAAANAILRIDRRSKQHNIHWIDWIVIAAYGLAMLGIGVYYSRLTTSSDDYLLGNRAMRPWMVGLSLFATLLSTISYLAYPGELIRFGPLILTSVLALPLVYLAVGWWLIPTLMAIRSASGYALLEERLGVGVRLLGASVFLVLRFIWMATIIYATANMALLPALNIDRSYTPLLCVILGLVTLCYTSLGGLRAVVLTDVIQSFILFGGAMVAVVLVTIHFGGLNWFPTSWPGHWLSPSFGLGFQDRITVTSAMIFLFTWYICTCGSDQMAIQRFKATSDVAAARRSFGVSLVAAFLVKAMLGLVGVAVMAFFLDQPDKLPDRTTVFSNADQMFPRFIVVQIPVGLTGLVISGIMAAAMSSLSSGISAATSVISDDFVKRFRGLPASDRATVTEERCISALIGALVVALSLCRGLCAGKSV